MFSHFKFEPHSYKFLFYGLVDLEDHK